MSNKSLQSTTSGIDDMDLDGGAAPTFVDRREEVATGNVLYDAGAPPESLIAEVEFARRESVDGGFVVQGEGVDDGGAAPAFA